MGWQSPLVTVPLAGIVVVVHGVTNQLPTSTHQTPIVLMLTVLSTLSMKLVESALQVMYILHLVNMEDMKITR